ncbi:NUDIX domain-containing protein [Flavobacteriaceae bacterium F89]|uniref:NUDIX domain-containing protein n=1 Tax=Cerina litoralis TaxID=2874477 RepID=A0AAE3EWQ3_9FLAO|nr:NUDIX domain-containing protein [Cerina litoralis]MCG2462492.1 NUDIX domain-containing protein [Cerina litoralis]
MDELVDILDNEGEFTGKTALKSEAHKNGWFHPTVHIWAYTKNGRILIQKRGADKETHPLLWDVSVAGHVGAGEKIMGAAIREVQEEIGLAITENDLEKIGVFKSIHNQGKELTDREFNHTYITELKIPLEKLQKQESEVEALALIPLFQFAEETWGMANSIKYVPHGMEYYKSVIKKIKEKL